MPSPAAGKRAGEHTRRACGQSGSRPAATGQAGHISENGTAQRLSPALFACLRLPALPALPAFPPPGSSRLSFFQPAPRPAFPVSRVPCPTAGTAVPVRRQRGRPDIYLNTARRRGFPLRCLLVSGFPRSPLFPRFPPGVFLPFPAFPPGGLAGTAVPVRRQQGRPDIYLKTARRRGLPSAPFACLRLPALPAFPALPALPAFPAPAARFAVPAFLFCFPPPGVSHLPAVPGFRAARAGRWAGRRDGG